MNATSSILDKLLQARYSTATQSNRTLNPTLETLLQHRSVRSYEDKALAPNTLELLIAAAQSASTSSNLQSWSVVAIEDPERKDRLARFAGNQEHIRTCPLFLVWLVDLARLDALGARRGLARDSLDYLELLMVGIIDATLAAQNAALAAESMGLGIVYIGGMRNQPEAVAAELGLPPRTFGVFGMCIGHPNPERVASVKPRLPQQAVLHREQYNAKQVAASADDYIATMANFYSSQGMKTNGDWDQHSLHRVRGPDAMAGRERLAAALQNLGFAMR
jgi:nitroreductase